MIKYGIHQDRSSSMIFDPEWFDQLQVNWAQAPDGMLGIHAYKKGRGCVYFEVGDDILEQQDMFLILYGISLGMWDKLKNEQPDKCPVCHRQFQMFEFRYKGHIFCRRCGSWLEFDGKKCKVIRSILET